MEFCSADYYADPSVRQRIVEYVGADHDPADSFGVSFQSALATRLRPPVDANAFYRYWNWLERGSEMHRSLRDRRGLLAHLDLEYIHFDRPAAAYLDPDHAFGVQHRVAGFVLRRLHQVGIFPLHLQTGRGHHFVWRIDFSSEACWRLAQLGSLSLELCEIYQAESLPLGVGAAHSGLGMLLEYLGHEVVRGSFGLCSIPVQLGEIEVGPGRDGREIVSLDLSAFGDPLHKRRIRVPFTPSFKPWRVSRQAGGDLLRKLTPPVCLPLPQVECTDPWAARDLRQCVDRARVCSTVIPDGSPGTLRLLTDYQDSRLADFHRSYYATQPHPPSAWARTYDRTPLSELPSCMGKMLARPNDGLLTPAGMQHLVRGLLSQNWHPRHVSGLFRSKFARDFGWIPEVHFYESGCRADFYTRLFAGLLHAGLDGKADFNCCSTQEKGYCPGNGCQHNLACWA